jgi:hypothetical protein
MTGRTPPPDLRSVKTAQKKVKLAEAKYQEAVEAREAAILAALEAGASKATVSKALALDEAMVRRLVARGQVRRGGSSKIQSTGEEEG